MRYSVDSGLYMAIGLATFIVLISLAGVGYFEADDTLALTAAPTAAPTARIAHDPNPDDSAFTP